MKNQELIEYLEEIIVILMEDLTRDDLFLCTMNVDTKTREKNSLNQEYLKLLKENKPTPTLHSTFYENIRYNKGNLGNMWWICLKEEENYSERKEYNVATKEINTQRVLFIKHLKEQLEQGIINP